MLRRIVATVVVLALATALALLAWPEALGLQRTQVIAQAVSFRGAAALAAGMVAVLLTALGFVLHRARVVLGVLAIVLLAFGGAEGAVLLQRGIGAPDLPKAGENDVTVLSWNTLGDSVPAAVVARVAGENGADVVALPETTEAQARSIERLLAASGHVYSVLSIDQVPGIRARSTSLLIARALGRYRIDRAAGDTEGVPSVVAVPAGGQHAPRIMAVHTIAPYRVDLGAWRSDLRWVAARCTAGNTVVAGDFNATLDHFAGLASAASRPLGSAPSGRLGACRDGALATANAGVGTWPTNVPALLGTPIDHVLATSNWRFAGFRVLSDEDAAGSDHRPVLARLTPAG